MLRSPENDLFRPHFALAEDLRFGKAGTLSMMEMVYANARNHQRDM
jgi:hypothetical protein